MSQRALLLAASMSGTLQEDCAGLARQVAELRSGRQSEAPSNAAHATATTEAPLGDAARAEEPRGRSEQREGRGRPRNSSPSPCPSARRRSAQPRRGRHRQGVERGPAVASSPKCPPAGRRLWSGAARSSAKSLSPPVRGGRGGPGLSAGRPRRHRRKGTRARPLGSPTSPGLQGAPAGMASQHRAQRRVVATTALGAARERTTP
eukprot:346091-Alexandrium_andersonii.AAC.1